MNKRHSSRITSLLLSGLLILIGNTISASPIKEHIPLYKQSQLPTETRVQDLLSRMTLDEKIMQLNQYILGLNTNGNNFGYTVEKVPGDIGSVILFCDNAVERNKLQQEALKTRLGIPILFGFDVIHGFRTIYPIPLGMGCSWNPQLIEDVSAMAAKEARLSGTEWVFSPMLDITHDPRWGRVAEGFGEDPHLVSTLGVAVVRGYQSNHLNSTVRVAACLKHFVGYGCSEGGRDYTATQISDQSLWDTFLPPFKAATEAGAQTAMSAFNDINGTPATANRFLLTEVLKKSFGMKGFVVSDWNAVVQLISQGHAANRKEAARLALNAGLDMDMIDNCFRDYLKELVEEKRVTMQTIDEAVTRILRIKFELGLFEHPLTKELPEKDRVLQPESLELAARIAEESMVLLKNEHNLLPLCRTDKIALIGPMVKERHELLGSWKCFGKDKDVQTLFEGMQEEFPDVELLYARGCDFDGTDMSGFDEACRVASEADVVVMMIGEKAAWSGENASRASLALPAIQEELVKTVARIGKPLVLVLSAGRPTELQRIEPLCHSILEIWQPGIRGGSPMAGILSGRINPSGRLNITFPLHTQQIPVYYNARQSSRPRQGHYQDLTIQPLYEFGHGLSYAKFVYGDLQAPKLHLKRGEILRIEIPVHNMSDRDGMETVQWYVRDPFSTITRPVRELRHFEKRLIRGNTTETFVLELDADRHLSYVNDQGNRILENGDYYIMVKDRTLHIVLED